MRKLALLSLSLYITIQFAAFASAAIQDSAIAAADCSGAVSLDTTEITAMEKNQTSTTVSSKLKKYESDVTEGSKGCGVPNGKTNSYEKADCASSSVFISEVSEPVGKATITLGTEAITKDSDGGVADLYKGICCLASGSSDENGTLCEETRTVYYAKYDECTGAAAYCKKVQWIFGSSGAGIIKTYVKQMYIFGAGIVGFIAVIIMVYSGIQISLSGASGDITAAKDRIIQSIMGIALLFFSGIILYTINPTFFN